MMALREGARISAVAIYVLTVACSDSSAPNLLGVADVRFAIQRSENANARAANHVFLSNGVQVFAIARDTVASLNVTVESIQALPLLNQNAAEDDSAWVTVEMNQAVTIDLTTLPTTTESPLLLARGSLAEGGYSDVRLFVSGAVIVFKGPLSLGAAITFAGNVEHAVTIPSGDQTGIKTNMAFNALADTEVRLVFDETASYSNVTLTGDGAVILAPVIRSSGN